MQQIGFLLQNLLFAQHISGTICINLELLMMGTMVPETY